jgi:predicted GNAT family N-acyltransferase
VFVDEQGVPLDEEVDEHDLGDARAVHALVRDVAGSVGTGRYYPVDAHSAQIGRMAVLPEARGRGAGRALLDALVTAAERHGFRRASLLAQVEAVPFYARAGFEPTGEEVWDAGMLHQPMEKRLYPHPCGGVRD